MEMHNEIDTLRQYEMMLSIAKSTKKLQKYVCQIESSTNLLKMGELDASSITAAQIDIIADFADWFFGENLIESSMTLDEKMKFLSEKFSYDIQKMQLIEEIGEVLQALSKLDRTRGIGQFTSITKENARTNLIEEIAGVQVMLKEITTTLGIQDKVEAQMESQTQRAINLLIKMYLTKGISYNSEEIKSMGCASKSVYPGWEKSILDVPYRRIHHGQLIL